MSNVRTSMLKVLGDSNHADELSIISAIILAAIAFSLPYVLSDPRASIPPQAVVSLQLLTVTYLTGVWKLPIIPTSFAAEYAEPLQAFYVVSNRVGAYFKGEHPA
jgi:hypothetical protein